MVEIGTLLMGGSVENERESTTGEAGIEADKGVLNLGGSELASPCIPAISAALACCSAFVGRPLLRFVGGSLTLCEYAKPDVLGNMARPAE